MIKNLPDLIEDFLRYLKVQKGRTALTVRNYRLYLKRFLNWGNTSRLAQAADLTREKLRDYRLWLTRQKSLSGTTLSSATQNYHLTALRSFVNYLRHKDVATIPASSISLNPPQKRKVIFLTANDRRSLLQAVGQSHEPTLVKMRDEAIIELIAVSGLRVSELVMLEKSQFNLSSVRLSIIRRSTAYDLPLTAEVCRLLKNYLEHRTDQTNHAFIRHDRAADNKPGRLTPRSVQRSLERYRKLAGLKQKVTPHTLRHSFAYQLATQGADLATLQKSLGLKHPGGTHVYKETNKPGD
ncbi:MAG TPA: hypothetical protein DEO26_03480 [Candidatus Veblenbacteria bacterium]|uniref:Tyrosine recombinase XerC n=2 Tax=Candidatus Vebleniibacteriota TaxID=1817921 RepID=A0A1G2Q6W1_9BACT|nr:MAG: Tyrosine recombinase XerC [Parcubacteria group bacterium GW2011_GWE2_43_12]OHA55549.1 MAG: hypothetical protein A2388_00520 [Candidatus Veblenbacteria bacterium RIFOXYB1_FULL_43_13]OHA56265.1 MAG: hypothetical protein A2429_02705 [Candidatus Veblenbacteria bacterium RIFOXYC1_FULL_42_9]HBZ36758.1 hypothetical protein [Candidatus Veblenbacteria bacterium]